jgi:hypothetical protein
LASDNILSRELGRKNIELSGQSEPPNKRTNAAGQRSRSANPWEPCDLINPSRVRQAMAAILPQGQARGKSQASAGHCRQVQTSAGQDHANKHKISSNQISLNPVNEDQISLNHANKH